MRRNMYRGVAGALSLLLILSGMQAAAASSEEASTEAATEESTEAATEETTEVSAEESSAFAGIDTSGLPHYDDPADFPHLDGSTATLPLSYALYEICTGATEEEAKNAIQHTKTNQCYYDLTDETATDTLILAYEPAEQVYTDLEESGVDYEMTAVGRDALVFLENKNNSVHELTTQEIRDIYTGKITNWSSLGGADQEITAFQREQGSGSQALMDKLVMQGEEMMEAPSHMMIGDMGELLAAVSSYDNSGGAIGYSVYFYVSRMNDLPDLQLVAVDGVSPTNATIQDGSYPFVHDFYAAIRSDADDDVKQIYEWLLSEAGQELIQAVGYVPVTDVASDTTLDQGAVAEAAVSGTVHLENEEVLLLDRQLAYGDTSGVSVLDSSLQEMWTIPSVSTTEMAEIVPMDELQTFYCDDTKKYGLFSLATNSWAFAPSYDYIESKGDLYVGHIVDTAAGTEQCAVYSDGNTRTFASGDAVYVLGTHVFDCSAAAVTIYDTNLNLSGTIDLAGQGLSGLYADNDVYYAADANGSEVLFDEDGNEILSIDTLPDAVFDLADGLEKDSAVLNILTCFPEQNLVLCTVSDGTGETSADFILDVESNMVLTEPGDTIDLEGVQTSPEGDVYCTVTAADGSIRILKNNDPTALSAEDGTAYTDILTSGDVFYLAYTKDDIFHADCVSDGSSVEIDLSDLPTALQDTITCGGKGIFTATSYQDDVGYVWKDGEVALTGTRAFAWGYAGLGVIGVDERQVVVDLETGEPLFEVPEGLVITWLSDPVILASGGNYLYILNRDGEMVFTCMDPAMKQD